VVTVPRGRGTQLAEGAKAARRGRWLMFLHADTVLEEGWHNEVRSFIEACEMRGREQAAAFAFRLDDFGPRARLLERMVALRCALFALPYGDQGLILSRRLYDSLGGYREMPLMEDVDLIRRIGRARLGQKRLGGAQRDDGVQRWVEGRDTVEKGRHHRFGAKMPGGDGAGQISGRS